MAKISGLTSLEQQAAPPEISALVEKFSEHRETYRRPGYNETQLRQDFLDPFFVALGWDVYNRDGIHENYRDVILEHALRVEKSVKAPDYCIRIGPVPKFFVEAKKPAVDIKSDVGPAELGQANCRNCVYVCVRTAVNTLLADAYGSVVDTMPDG